MPTNAITLPKENHSRENILTFDSFKLIYSVGQPFVIYLYSVIRLYHLR